MVGRDALIGVALGIWFALLFRSIAAIQGDGSVNFPGEVETLLGLRSTVGVILEEALYAVRNVLFYFFILFVLRMMLRSQWAAIIAFTAFFTVLNALGNERVWLGGVIGLLYFGTAAFVIVRFGGLLAFVIGAFVSSLLFDVVLTLDSSAWYLGSTRLRARGRCSAGDLGVLHGDRPSPVGRYRYRNSMRNCLPSGIMSNIRRPPPCMKPLIGSGVGVPTVGEGSNVIGTT